LVEVTNSPNFEEIVAALRGVDAYPWRPQSVDVIETHISWVFLAGDRVLKLKRPIDYGFVDYSTREIRRSACDDEVRLNRRLSTGIYLGVATITVANGRISVDGEGEAVEWATLMRRLPADGMLDSVLQRGSVCADAVERIANRLIEFHRDLAERCGDSSGSPDRQLRIVNDNLADLAPFADSPLSRVQFEMVSRSMESFLESGMNIFAGRVREGWIREGHGDLRTDHICLDESGQIQIFDCVEFNFDIRCADIASDLAFLLVDLDRLSASDIAARLIAAYRAAALDLPTSLLRFYRGHRALVKAKVACLSWRDLPPEHRQQFFEEATVYLDLAMAATTSKKPFIIAMTGLSGTGKSIAATSLSRALGAAIVASDVVRREMELPEKDSIGWQQGRYAPDKRVQVYQEMIRRVQAIVAKGKPVILDASFLETERREDAARAAKSVDIPLVFVETVADDDVVRKRLRNRAALGDSPSEATVEVYEHQRAQFSAAPPGVPAGAEHIQVDTTADGPVNLDKVYEELKRLGVLLASLDAR
jgi:aminoglycoside phosphotransferase family enzyme/predicted kinase